MVPLFAKIGLERWLISYVVARTRLILAGSMLGVQLCNNPLVGCI
jgi:hypothetical protein